MSLRVSDLRVHYQTLKGEVKALDGVSFEVGDGEILGLAGESGCGKTTLGKSLIRMDGRMRHIGGEVELDGEVMPIGDDRPGMKQRMVMVISTLLDPSLLIADEVTSALDVSTQKAVARALAGFRDNGVVKSMIFITHDISLTYQIADTIMIMYAGKVAERAPAKVIVEAPRHPYTKLLIDSLPEVGVRHADRKLAGIPGGPPSLLDPPTGCRFRDRCPLAYDRCAEEPPAVEIEPNHVVACWKA
ncbi:ABC transporter ATP-binding protein [Sphaerisporangium sp. NPDC088356]|uniref:ABC transporter ATP-binding protein n=1 Tax=Sphaerisporangium sp. NPDC088356 TaxID=3154871 RepID=UPI00341AC270